MNIDSSLARLERGQHHADALKDAIVGWAERSKNRLSQHTNSESTQISATIHFSEEPDKKLWGLMLSDAVHNVRSALDNVVYAALAKQYNPIPDGHSRKIAFILCDTPDWFTGQQRKIDFLSEAVQKAIEKFQPYNRPHAQLPPLLAVLRDMNDSDKHRLIVPALANMRDGVFSFPDGLPVEKGQPLEVKVYGGDLKNGSEVASLSFSRPYPNLKFKTEINLQVVVRHKPGANGATKTEVSWLLNAFIEEVRLAVNAINEAAG